MSPPVGTQPALYPHRQLDEEASRDPEAVLRWAGSWLDGDAAQHALLLRLSADRVAAREAAVAVLIKALDELPDEAGMIEHNPDEGMRAFCCGGDVAHNWRGSDRVQHASDCWYVRLRAAAACVRGGP